MGKFLSEYPEFVLISTTPKLINFANYSEDVPLDKSELESTERFMGFMDKRMKIAMDGFSKALKNYYGFVESEGELFPVGIFLNSQGSMLSKFLKNGSLDGKTEKPYSQIFYDYIDARKVIQEHFVPGRGIDLFIRLFLLKTWKSPNHSELDIWTATIERTAKKGASTASAISKKMDSNTQSDGIEVYVYEDSQVSVQCYTENGDLDDEGFLYCYNHKLPTSEFRFKPKKAIMDSLLRGIQPIDANPQGSFLTIHTRSLSSDFDVGKEMYVEDGRNPHGDFGCFINQSSWLKDRTVTVDNYMNNISKRIVVEEKSDNPKRLKKIESSINSALENKPKLGALLFDIFKASAESGLDFSLIESLLTNPTYQIDWDGVSADEKLGFVNPTWKKKWARKTFANGFIIRLSQYSFSTKIKLNGQRFVKYDTQDERYLISSMVFFISSLT